MNKWLRNQARALGVAFEDLAERAAILEYDGGHSRKDAEQEAVRELRKRKERN